MFNIKILSPQLHRFVYHTHFKSTIIYYEFIKNWLKLSKRYGTCKAKDKDGKELKNTNKIKSDLKIYKYNFEFRSKHGITWRKVENEHKNNFEYEFKLISDDKLRKLYFSFKPQLENSTYGKHEEYGDYQPYRLIKGTGVSLTVDSTYFDYFEIVKILRKLFKYFDIGIYYNSQEYDKSTIPQYEVYVRYNEKKENDVAHTIKLIDDMIGLDEDVYKKVTMMKRKSKYDMYFLKSNKFGELGFFDNNSNWKFGVKTYRLKEHQNLDKYNNLKHPKLEVSLDYKKLKKYPTLEEIDVLRETLTQLIGNIIIWSKLKESDFLGDSYFNPEKKLKVEIIERIKIFKKLKHLTILNSESVKNEANKSNSIFDYFYCIVINRHCTYKNLVNYTKLSYDWIKKITHVYRDMGLIEVIRSSVNIIQFKNNKMHEFCNIIFQGLKKLKMENDNSIELRRMSRVYNREKRGVRKLIKEHLDELEIKELFKNGIIKIKDKIKLDKIKNQIKNIENLIVKVTLSIQTNGNYMEVKF